MYFSSADGFGLLLVHGLFPSHVATQFPLSNLALILSHLDAQHGSYVVGRTIRLPQSPRVASDKLCTEAVFNIPCKVTL